MWTLSRMETLLALRFHEVHKNLELEKKKKISSGNQKMAMRKKEDDDEQKKRLLCPHIFYETYVF